MKFKCHFSMCKNTFEKNHPSKKFCSTRCKDRHHNHVNPRGKFAHLNKKNMTDEEWYFNTLHPFSSEALGQE